MIAITKILVPFDFSEKSEVALKYGLALAERFAAALHVLHVLEYPLSDPVAAEEGGSSGTASVTAPEENIRRRLGALLLGGTRERVPATCAYRTGSPCVEINGYAEEHHVELIVMGTRSRDPSAQTLLGSVTDAVIRHAPCPVLVVRHPEREFVMP